MEGFIAIWRAYKLPLILGGVSLFFIVSSVILMVKLAIATTPIKFSEEVAGSATKSASLVVDIQGAVVSPGVYELGSGSRVADAIKAAGGLSTDADSVWIAKALNQAQILVDGAKIFIPGKNDRSPVNNFVTSHNYDSLSGQQGQSQNESVSINFASQAELENLPGIGPATGSKIINNRPYQTLEELVIKKVISRNLFDKLKNQLTL